MCLMSQSEVFSMNMTLSCSRDCTLLVTLYLYCWLMVQSDFLPEQTSWQGPNRLTVHWMKRINIIPDLPPPLGMQTLRRAAVKISPSQQSRRWVCHTVCT